MRQLVSSWVEAQRHGYHRTLGMAIKELGRECAIKLTYSRLSEWRKGKYTPSQKVLSQLFFDVLPWVLQEAGVKVTAEQQDVLDGLIWNVKVVDGERQIELL